MTFSACCITRSKWAFWCLVVSLSASFLLGQETEKLTASVPADAVPSLEQIEQNNNLEGEGKLPFHLRASYRLSDLKGRPTEQGTIDYWWAQDGKVHLDVQSPSLGLLHTLQTEAGTNEQRRAVYLLKEMLGELRLAGSGIKFLRGETTVIDRKVGNASLKCAQAHLAGDPSEAPSTQVCFDPKFGVIRFITSGDRSLVRNRIASFGKTYVALDAELDWNHRSSISAHVDELKTFKLGDQGVPADLALVTATSGNIPNTTKLRKGVVTGRKIAGLQPSFPEKAFREGVSGTVALGGTIAKDGKVVDLFPIASPDYTLTDAAEEAIKHWAYQPFLLGASPVAVDTVFEIRFLSH